MRELTATELNEVSGGIQFGLDYDQGASLELAVAGFALTVGAPVAAGFAFSAAVMLSIVGYASERAAEQNANGTTSGSGRLSGGSWNATGGSRIPQSESS